MHLLEQYVRHFNTGDSKVLAAAFHSDCVFIDLAPVKAGNDPMWVYGSECIDMIFGMLFAVMDIKLELLKREGSAIDYIVKSPGFNIPCRGALLEEKDGKIKRYIVHFREN